MKKSLLFIIAAGMFVFASCGPSAEEKAKLEQHEKDSIAAAESARINDSIASVQKMVQDSIDMAMKAAEDSLKMQAMQDSLDKANAKLKASARPKTSTPKINPATGLPTKAVLTEEEKKLPAATQEKILKARQKMLDMQNKK